MGVLLIVAAIAGSVAVGVVAERRKPQAAAMASRRALTLILYGLIPPVVFFNLAASEVDVEHGVGLVLGLISVAIAGTLAWWIATRALRLSRPAVGAVICAVITVNSAYLGYPMTVALLGRDALPTAVLYDLAVAAPSVLLGAFAVGAAFGTRAGESPRDRVRAFFTRNPPLYAAIAGLLAPRALAPDLLVDASQILVIAILPIGFFAVGATLAENAEHGELPMPPPLTRPVVLALVGRLAIAPGLLILMAAPLVDLPAAYLLIAAMPTGINSMVVAHAYGLDMEITAEAVTWSTGLVVAAALASLLI
jgi:predicted permease